MKNKELYDEDYEGYLLEYPEAYNPELDEDVPEVREQLVVCVCGNGYRVRVNGIMPISDADMKGVICPFCRRDAREHMMVSGHSGGLFNATRFKEG